MQTASADKLMKDLQAVVIDTEELIKATASQTGERVDKVRSRAEESLRAARAAAAGRPDGGPRSA